MDLDANATPCCFSSVLQRQGATLPLPALHDAEGERLSEGAPPVVDAHVHLFPDGVFEALWHWFETNAWPIRYKLKTPQVIEFLFSRGVKNVVALHYAHKPHMAEFLNRYMMEVAATDARIIPLATVFPGEPHQVQILQTAFQGGLRGVKLHCHVQLFSPDADLMHDIYSVCSQEDRPLWMHAGREPASPAYKKDVYTLCHVDRIEAVLKSFPKLKLVVPHLGADEFQGYERLLEKYENLFLDTTMMCADYFPFEVPQRLFQVDPKRILYGSDFPNLPYAWDREIRTITALKLSETVLADVLGQNTLRLFQPRIESLQPT
jgi:uncharacterized protein